MRILGGTEFERKISVNSNSALVAHDLVSSSPGVQNDNCCNPFEQASSLPCIIHGLKETHEILVANGSDPVSRQ